MAKEKKMKKGSALIPWGIVVIVLGFALAVVGKMSSQLEILFLIGGVLNPIGWLMLVGGIVIAIIRGVKAKKAAKAAEQEERPQRRSSGSKNPGFSKEEMDKYGLKEEDFEDEPRRPSKPNRLGAGRSGHQEAQQKSSGGHRYSFEELRVNEMDSDIECAIELDDVMATLLPQNADDDICYDFRPQPYDDYADKAKALYTLGQDKNKLMKALKDLMIEVRASRSRAKAEFYEYRVVTADLILTVADVLFANGLINRAMGLLYNVIGYIEKNQDGEFDDIEWTNNDDQDEDDVYADVWWKMQYKLYVFVTAAKEYYDWSDFDGEEGGTPDYIDKLGSLLIPNGDITYHKGFDVRTAANINGSIFDPFEIDDIYNEILAMPSKTKLTDVIKEKLDKGILPEPVKD